MLDLNFVRDNLQLVRQKLAERGVPDLLADFETLDRERRTFLSEAESRKARRNKVSAEIAALKKQKQDASALIAEMQELGPEIVRLDEQAKAQDEKLRELLIRIPNVPHSTVPVGKSAADNQEIRGWGEPRQFDFQPKAHWELGP
ncbi:MAG: serine--tRNA ligase, partial [Terriglobia bacterium]